MLEPANRCNCFFLSRVLSLDLQWKKSQKTSFHPLQLTAYQPIILTMDTTQVMTDTSQRVQPPQHIFQAHQRITDPHAAIAHPHQKMCDPLVKIIDPYGEITDPLSEITDPLSEITDPLTGIIDPHREICTSHLQGSRRYCVRRCSQYAHVTHGYRLFSEWIYESNLNRQKITHPRFSGAGPIG